MRCAFPPYDWFAWSGASRLAEQVHRDGGHVVVGLPIECRSDEQA
jgi:hypothetical protein